MCMLNMWRERKKGQRRRGEVGRSGEKKNSRSKKDGRGNHTFALKSLFAAVPYSFNSSSSIASDISDICSLGGIRDEKVFDKIICYIGYIEKRRRVYIYSVQTFSIWWVSRAICAQSSSNQIYSLGFYVCHYDLGKQKIVWYTIYLRRMVL